MASGCRFVAVFVAILVMGRGRVVVVAILAMVVVVADGCWLMLIAAGLVALLNIMVGCG